MYIELHRYIIVYIYIYTYKVKQLESEFLRSGSEL